MKRRFHVGQTGEFAGTRWRIVRGRKSKDDLRLEIKTEGWVPISMALTFLQADFYSQNEETLQAQGAIGRSVGQRAGARFINFCAGAQLLGWEWAYEQLQEERARKRAA